VKLDAYTYDRNVFELQPLEIKMQTPSWWSKLKNTIKEFDPRSGIHVPCPTVKACPGVVNYIRKPIVFKLWSDVIFKVNPNGSVKYVNPERSPLKFEASQHSNEQVGNELYANRAILKLHVPWAIKGSDKTEFMLTECHYTEDLRKHDILVSPGILNFYEQHTINVFLVFPVKEEPYEVLLKYGTPLMSMYPMTDKKVEIKNHLTDRNTIADLLDNFPSTFFGRYYLKKKVTS